MHPELEFFLESAFSSIQPGSEKIGRVVVEPDYNMKPDRNDAGDLSQQLTECLRDRPLTEAALGSFDGLEVRIPGECTTLKKYIRRITLHADPVEGAWIEVAPPGNWI
jgi:hypothetical protein